jgi:hypothetical protein
MPNSTYGQTPELCLTQPPVDPFLALSSRSARSGLLRSRLEPQPPPSPTAARLGSTPASLRSSTRPARLGRVWRRLPAPWRRQDRTEEVPWSQALIVTEDDTRLWKLKAGDPFDHAHLDRMREWQAYGQKLKDSMSRLSPAALAVFDPLVATMDDKDRAAIEKINATEARADQLIAALDHRREELRVARDRSGETAAEERRKQLMDEKYAAYARVANTRAWTLSGVLAKLALIAPDVDDEWAS